MTTRTLLLISMFALAAPATASEPADPLASVMWDDMRAKFFAGAAVEFDERVKVAVPGVVENQAQVPVTADARALGPVVKLVVFADLNPIQHVLTLTPREAEPYVAFRMKVEQGTPVRAAALTADGVWHVGGAYLDAAGGGCSAPATARKDADWSETVGQTQGRLWREAGGATRVRLRIRHPMDTGLSKDNIPAFFIERLEMKGNKGGALAELELFEPVAEDPTLTLLVRLPLSETGVAVDGRDNNGTHYRSVIPASWRQSAVESGAGERR
ncbi:MAG: quinoprotein dehydrogenase-associated SoxYZ-like carrier [Pseudomonadota bacterium]